ncbi:uncharacterized protein [Rhodnius prolixus]|uniref:uncharacterized protein n=1 Tax=Rhodnius prolixus TaxID=13249 RepID=UPI003D18F252
MYQDSTDIGVDLFQFLYRRAFVLNIDESLANVFYSVAGPTKRSFVKDKYMLEHAKNMSILSDVLHKRRKKSEYDRLVENDNFTGSYDFHNQTMNMRRIAKEISEKSKLVKSYNYICLVTLLYVLFI